MFRFQDTENNFIQWEKIYLCRIKLKTAYKRKKVSIYQSEMFRKNDIQPDNSYLKKR